ncbi:MAG: hypothetical protein QOI12_4085 [Alphaproteobacteria bacterium]|jgi:hypothetical protein|nr:hypothetical protein [Alphaproteobacteria bacterium]
MEDPNKATLEHAAGLTGRDGAVDFAARRELAGQDTGAALSQRTILAEGSDYSFGDHDELVLTEQGFDRMCAAHGSGVEVVIVADEGALFVLPAKAR